MWVFLNNAFLSIVADKGNVERLLVRARKKGDIEAIFKERGVKLKVSHTPEHDYPYRTFVPRALVTLAMSREVAKIEYTNFKDSVPDQNRHDAYLGVWSRMVQWQRDPSRWGGGMPASRGLTYPQESD